jgi:hypothetical protein
MNIVERINDAKIEIHNIKSDLESGNANYRQQLNDINIEISYIENKLKELKEKRDVLQKSYPEKVKLGKQKINSLTQTVAEYEEQLGKYPEENITELKEQLDNYEEMMNNISRIVLVNETSESNISERDKAIMEYEAYNRKIEDVRGKKKDLIAKADLGVDNISIEDDFVKIDGFEFKENQISKSEAILLVSKMMCAINEAPIQVIGSANDLDWNTLDQLYNVAQNRGKIMILDQVDREASDIAVVAYEPHTGIVDTDTGEITQSSKTEDNGQTSLL